ncbi:N-acetylmuramoyl-L-alanine amidase [Streptomyces sp. PR69]|uniref:N-acetylmuramoyl-L-alanine amidase n=1 Tax=Streptomyces sp. PR69 TaxID=2984950 RepID=UPI0022654C50|nr:N-acetylmuramoyl-L-alanine amidase [Streptomyces sp. PR69]
MSRRHRKDRKKKRLVYGVAAGVVASATIGTMAVATPGLLAGRNGDRPVPAGAVLQSQFDKAAKEFDVPKNVLMAVAYRQTRWESHNGEPSTTGAYNVMGLTQVNPDDLEEDHADHSNGGGHGTADDPRLEHVNRSGDPSVEKHFDAGEALAELPEETVDTDDPRLHTLDEAAELIDESAESLKEDTGDSVRAGAALLAEYQRQATGELSDDPGDWYPAVARYSQSPDVEGAEQFAERVYESIRTGERRITAEGQQVTLPPDPSVTPDKPAKPPLAATPADTRAAPAPDCPSSLNCDFRPAAYQQNSDETDWGNYNVANRPEAGYDIRYIALHDTEGDYASALNVFQNSRMYASAHYLIRASDGLVTQMVENKNEAWHAGNKTLNMHSIGIEHEGYAMKEGSWYTEPQYESSAALVKHLAAKYDIPLDREHIIGHDEIPGVLDHKVRAQHWDPGPYWDWNHYMSLLGAPTGDSGAGGPVKAGQLVRIVPPFSTANQPPLTKGGTSVKPRPSNFGYLYTSPSTGAPKITDPYFPTVLWSEGSNWSNKVRAGGEYVVADATHNWTAIWYGGKKAWFHNPGGQYTAPAGTTAQPLLTPRDGLSSIPVYGRAYPDEAAYAGTGVPVQDDNSASLTEYSVPAGQKYTRAGGAVKGDYYYGGTFDGTGAGSRTRVEGSNVFYPIRYNHRIAWVRASDVQQVPSTLPDQGDDRFNLLGRDAYGGLWQYQGTGSASAPFFHRYRIGGGWQTYDTVTAMDTLRADAVGDMMAREPDGDLYYYAASGDPDHPFRPRIKVGYGFQIYDRLIGVFDVTGDGEADFVGRDKSGVLWLYRGTGNPSAPYEARTRIGGGWNMFDLLSGVTDLDGDGLGDMLARQPDGALWLYQGTGDAARPFTPMRKIGTGWHIYDAIQGNGDYDRDGEADFVGRDKSGVLWLYRGTGNPSAPYEARTRIGSGWNMFDLLI